VILGISGGSGSGKTAFARAVQEKLGTERCSLLQQDAYYHDHSDRFDYDGGSVNFDHPDAIDFALLAQHLEELRAGRSVEIPVYDFATHRRLETTQTLHVRPFVLVEGMLIFSQQVVRESLDVKVFIAASEKTRLRRRLVAMRSNGGAIRLASKGSLRSMSSRCTIFSSSHQKLTPIKCIPERG